MRDVMTERKRRANGRALTLQKKRRKLISRREVLAVNPALEDYITEIEA